MDFAHYFPGAADFIHNLGKIAALRLTSATSMRRSARST